MVKKPIKVFLSEEEREMLTRVASAVGEDLSSYVRHLVLRHLYDISLLKERIYGAEEV